LAKFYGKNVCGLRWRLATVVAHALGTQGNNTNISIGVPSHKVAKVSTANVTVAGIFKIKTSPV
jgi:hypothetical protein